MPRTTCPPRTCASSTRSCPFGFAAAVQAVQGLRRRSQRGELAAGRRGHGRGHRRAEHHRGDHGQVARVPLAAQDLAVLHPGQHHQRGGRAGVDPFRHARPEPRAGHRLHDVHPLDRHRRAHDPVRRRRRDGRRRLRDGVHAARPRQLRPGARAVDCATTSPSAPAGRGTATATASSWRKAPARSCSRSTSTRGHAAPGSTPSSPASA